MAGDWIKVCKETPYKPEILVIATKLSIHPDIAFARCFQLWSWFDSNTKDGVTSGVTKVTIDALLNRDGLCDTLVSVGWLCENEQGNLYLPNFDRHNSETAKTRALGNKRQSKHRDKSNAECNANVTLDALPEKRIEEKNNNNTKTPLRNRSSKISMQEFLKECNEKKERRIPESDPVFDYAEKIGIPLDMIKVCWNEFVRTHLDNGKTQKDWRATFRNYVCKNYYKLWFIEVDGSVKETNQYRALKKLGDFNA